MAGRGSSFSDLLPNPRFGFDSIGSTDIIVFPWQQCQRSRRVPEAKFEPTDSSAKAEGEIGSKLASVLFSGRGRPHEPAVFIVRPLFFGNLVVVKWHLKFELPGDSTS